jgi:hypothetical protein
MMRSPRLPLLMSLAYVLLSQPALPAQPSGSGRSATLNAAARQLDAAVKQVAGHSPVGRELTRASQLVRQQAAELNTQHLLSAWTEWHHCQALRESLTRLDRLATQLPRREALEPHRRGASTASANWNVTIGKGFVYYAPVSTNRSLPAPSNDSQTLRRHLAGVDRALAQIEQNLQRAVVIELQSDAVALFP